MRLIDLQRDFQASILQVVPSAGAARMRLEAAIRPGTVSVEQRLCVHSHLYQNLADSLGNGFAETRKYLGSERWLELVRDYLLEYPPMDAVVARLAEHLPEFVREHRMYRDDLFLSDLVRWDFLRRRAYCAAVEVPLVARHLEGPEHVRQNLRIRLKRRAYLVEVSHPLHAVSVTRAATPARIAPIVLFGNVKRGTDVPRPVTSGELRGLRMLEEGTTVGALERTLRAHLPADEASAQWARWLTERVMTPAGTQ